MLNLLCHLSLGWQKKEKAEAVPTAAAAALDLPFARPHTPLPGHPGLKEHPWKQDTVPGRPAAPLGASLWGTRSPLRRQVRK